MNVDQSITSSEPIEEQPPPSLYDILARSIDFADGPGRSTTMSVETTDNDPFLAC